MWFRKKKCEVHDMETVKVDIDFDILRRLEREGCPVIVDRTVIGLNPSGEPIHSEDTLTIQIGDHVLEHYFNQSYRNRVCLQCKKVISGCDDAEKKWRAYIKEYGDGYRAKVEKRKERKSKAERIWKEKYDTNK